MSKELSGKIALVTGASGGIGRAIAIALANLGANIIVHYNSNKVNADEVVDTITKLGVKAIALQANLANLGDIENLFKEIVKEFSVLDILVNNAGILMVKTVMEFTESDFDTLISTDLKGAFFCIKEAYKIMRNDGRIINISSSITVTGGARFSIYGGAKAALEQITKACANEFAVNGVTVNTVSPAFTETKMLNKAIHEKAKNASPFKRIGQPEDIANVVAFLCTTKACWITGQNIQVNGGAFMPS